MKAVIGGTTGTGESVSTSINAGVAAFAAPAAEATVALTGATFVWSDQAGDSTTPTHSAATLDWDNEFLIKNIPTDSQTLSR